MSKSLLTTQVASVAGGGTGGGFVVRSSAAAFGYYDTAGGTDGKMWDTIVGGGAWALRLINDANSAAATVLQMTRSGTTAGLFSVNASMVIAGPVNAGASSPLLLKSTSPFMGWQNTTSGLPADTGVWDFGVSGTTAANNYIALRAVNDANSVQTAIFSHTGRSGTTLGTTALNATAINLNAATVVSGTLNVNNFAVVNIDQNNGFTLNGASTNSTGYVANNTSSGGHSWTFGAAGSQGVLGVAGSFFIYDNTANVLRMNIDSVGGLQYPGGANFGGAFTVNATSTVNGLFAINNAGGSSYGGQFSMLNTSSGATNPRKYWRINPSGGLELVNSASSAVIFAVQDSGSCQVFNGLQVTGAITASANVSAVDVYASRGDGTGVIFFGGGGHYIYWDGTNYQMVQGSVNIPSGSLNVSTNINAANGQIRSSLDGMAFDSSGTSTLQASTIATGSNAGAALMSFVRQGAYGVKIGLDTNNFFAIGGWSDGSGSRVYWDTSGNQVTRGIVRSGSDVRQKTDFAPVQDIVAKLLSVDAFTYTDIRTSERRIGVSAQTVQPAFPEGVSTDEEGMMSVAYGNVALAALVEYAKVMEARVSQLERMVEMLS